MTVKMLSNICVMINLYARNGNRRYSLIPLANYINAIILQTGIIFLYVDTYRKINCH